MKEENHKNTPVRSIVDVINVLQKYNTLHAEERHLTGDERAMLDIVLDFSRKCVDSFKQANERQNQSSIISPHGGTLGGVK